MVFRKLFILLCLAILLGGPVITFAQVLHNDYQGTWRGEVLEVLDEEMKVIHGTDTKQLYQTIEVKVLSGPEKGEVIKIENDYLELEKGDKFYFNHYKFIDGVESYGVVNIDRRGSLYFLIAIFIFAVVVFGKWQGVRSLLALAGSFLVIFYVLMPTILAGWNPILVSSVVASGILFVAIFFTHGFNRESLVAYAGTMLAVLLTGLFATFAVHITDLSGFSSEVATSLNFNTRGSLDLTALLLGAIIIGVLGVLDDIAVTQAAVVTELYSSNPKMTKTDVYKRAMRVGREHVGALVNTLVLAYAGASLPLLLHAYMVSSGFAMAMNTELFATEIVRAIVGSIGLVLAVPIVTLLAVLYLKDYTPKNPSSRGHSH